MAVNPLDKKTKKVTLPQMRKKVWDRFSLYIRLRDAKRDEMFLDGEAAYCITCGKPYPIRGKGCLQAGHFIPGRNNQVLFDERQVYAQCYICNYKLKGNWPVYLAKMKDMWGNIEVQQMLDTHREPKKYTIPELEELLSEINAKINQLDS